jgi:hypothetical protein
MTATLILLVVALLFLNAGSFSSKADQLPVQMSGKNPQLQVVDDPGFSVGPGWEKNLDSQTQATVAELTATVKKYAIDHDGHAPKTLDELVEEGYMKEIPQAPPGKEFAISQRYRCVVLIDKKASK